jgi:catechol 2,3-dioxygenase-like lactoylglutathione lyase family enzyme
LSGIHGGVAAGACRGRALRAGFPGLGGELPTTYLSRERIVIFCGEHRKEIMQHIIDKLIGDFECGALSRRQLALSLAALVTSAKGAPSQSGMHALSLNHVTVRVPNVNRTSQFYQELFGMPLKQHSEKTHILGVGKSFFGIEQKDGGPALDHYDFGIAGFNADQAAAKLKARNLTLEPGGTKESFKFRDPDGFLVQLNGPDYVGHVGS